MIDLLSSSSYALVIAEKADAAKRIASALGTATRIKIAGIEVFAVEKGLGGKDYRVCAASGHLYVLTTATPSRTLYPTFDVEWRPLVSRFSSSEGKVRGFRKFPTVSVTKRIKAFAALSREANCFVHACDYDLEGETIGWNILEYACKKSNSQVPAFRAHFSTLTPSDIRESFSKLQPIKNELASAGRARHAIDFMWGINFSRALTEVRRTTSGEYRNLTIGRVQTPTLAFVVHREIEIRTHVPIPYWSIVAVVEKNGKRFDASRLPDKIASQKEARDIFSRISAEPGAQVRKITHALESVAPPYPFNTGKLQEEAFRLFRLAPSVSLSVAERLYLQALISYPRTDSQKLPPTINYKKILDSLANNSCFSDLISDLSRSKRTFPAQGPKDDPAHPAIFPTGLRPSRSLNDLEEKIYELIVRQFLAAFADDSIEEEITVELTIGEHRFNAEGARIVSQGWRKFYPYFPNIERILPALEEGHVVRIISRDLQEKLTNPNKRFDQASLLKKMESSGIGTKATRAQTIATLVKRGYITSERIIAPSEISLSLIRSLESHSPDITSEELTRDLEKQLSDVIEDRRNSTQVIADSMSRIVQSLEKIRSHRNNIGADLCETIPLKARSSMEPEHFPKQIIFGKCPKCAVGSLGLIVSKKTGKRFIGCSKYSLGCCASAPVPQRGRIRPIGSYCGACKWPQVSVIYGDRRSSSHVWNLCPNPKCPKRKGTN